MESTWPAIIFNSIIRRLKCETGQKLLLDVFAAEEILNPDPQTAATVRTAEER